MPAEAEGRTEERVPTAGTSRPNTREVPDIELGPKVGIPGGARVVLPNKKIEDALSEDEKAKFQALLGPAPAPPGPAAAAQALIVDDDARFRQMAAAALKSWEVEALEVANGTEALKALASRRVDFLLLELRLAGHDGFEVIRCARSYLKLRDTSIIVASRLSDARHEAAALDLGADMVFPKPMTDQILRSRLKPLIRRLYDRLA